jgi:hypothetical protein
MKKLFIYAMIAGLCFASDTLTLKAASAVVPVEKSLSLQQSETMVARLHTIKEMDLSKLNRAEKKSLRAEVLSIQKSLKTTDGGIYLSVGAIIIILLILILVF